MSTLPAPVLKKPCRICGGDANTRNNWRRECTIPECTWRHLARQYSRAPDPLPNGKVPPIIPEDQPS